jgi:cellulose synthase/poly-beta-1,6-N-acetylglucosamine synthase-like glycosyltransferase
MAARLQDSRIGAVLGPVFKRPGGRGFFFLYQVFDHAIRYMYLAASTGLGSAGGGFGNNLIIRKAALDAVGGYGSVPFSVTEDAALVTRIRSHSKFKVRAACGYDVQVITASEKTWSDFLKQTLRWNNGGLFSPDLETRLNFGFLMITISMGILAFPLLPVVPRLWPLPFAIFIAMIMNTLAAFKIAGPALPRFKYPWVQGWKYLIQLLFTPAYFTFLTILAFVGVKPTWKGEKLGVKEALSKLREF